MPSRLRPIALVICACLLAGCAARGPGGSTARVVGARPPAGQGSSSAPGSAAAAWLTGTHPAAAAVVGRIVQEASNPADSPAIPLYIDALTGECTSALPAAGAALPPLASPGVLGEGYAPADALAQVLLRCPPPAGAAGAQLAGQLVAYVSGPDPALQSPYLPAALARDVPAEQLREALPDLTPDGAELVAQDATPAHLFALLVAAQDLPVAAAVAGPAGGLPDATLEAWLQAPQLTARQLRIQLMRDIRGTVAQPPFTAWLKAAATREADPAVAEAMWSRLYLSDQDPQALGALNRLADADGTFWVDVPGVDVWDWHLLLPAIQADPSGYLARGVAAYEAVEGGRPYFVVQRCPGTGPCQAFASGDAQYDPAREIPGWEAFLREYPGHPAAADAAYRLARCEEILGDWSDALRDMELAAEVYPDGQIAPEAQGRLDFMLDVEIPAAALAALAASPPLPALAGPIRYALAVRQLRAGQYAQAATDLPADPPPAAPGYPWDTWPLAASAAIQRQEAAQLAALAPSAFPQGYDPEPPSGSGTVPRADFAPPPAIGDPAAAYRIAQLLYDDDLALYAEFWQGGQQDFYAFSGDINRLMQGDLRPPWMPQLLASNTYVEAEPIFAAIAADAAAPAGLRARAAYSAGECLVHLAGYNVVVGEFIAGSVLEADIVSTFRAFAADFPTSGTLVPDALLTVARFTRAQADVQAVVRGFPGTWQAQAAEGLRTAWNPVSPLVPSTLAFERLTPSGVASGSGLSSRVGADGWTTVVVAPPDLPPGDGVAIQDVTDLASGAASVRWALAGPPASGALPWMQPSPVEEIAVPAVLTSVTFAGPSP